MSQKAVFEAIERATGVDPDKAPDVLRDLAYKGAIMVISHTPQGWERPQEIEKELEGVLSDIRALRKRIIKLDGYSLSMARRRQDPLQEEIAKIDVAEVLRQLKSDLEAQGRGEQTPPRLWHQIGDAPPIENWVDKAALRHLDELEKCLIAPIEAAIASAPSGRGRPKNRRAYRIAEFAVGMFVRLTGEKPTYWNGTETKFSRLVEELFQIGGVKADIRKPIEAAMSKLEA